MTRLLKLGSSAVIKKRVSQPFLFVLANEIESGTWRWPLRKKND